MQRQQQTRDKKILDEVRDVMRLPARPSYAHRSKGFASLLRRSKALGYEGRKAGAAPACLREALRRRQA